MYESHYGFAEKPFNLTPDPKYLYLSQRHTEAFAHLEFGRRERGALLTSTSSCTPAVSSSSMSSSRERVECPTVKIVRKANHPRAPSPFVSTAEPVRVHPRRYHARRRRRRRPRTSVAPG